MRRSSLRLIVVYSVCAGLGSLGAACGQQEKDLGSSGWQTSEFTEPDIAEPDVSDLDPDVEPSNNVAPEDLAPDGAACASGTECEGGNCLTGDQWPEGYCTTDSCAGSCGSPDSGCVDSDLGNFCADYCGSNSDCRPGYGCQNAPGSPGRVCLPASGASDGGACSSDDECAGDYCVLDFGGVAAPEGYCTTTGCENFEDCNSAGGENNKCLRAGRGQTFCVRICAASTECREGYVCEMFGNGEGMCSPDPAVALPPEVFEGNPFELLCQPVSGGVASIDYTVSADSTSYMVTPIAKDGRQIYPNQIGLPGGGAVDLEGANFFQSIPAYLYGGMNPTVVPATAQNVGQLEAGDHSYRIQTDSAELCHYVLEESTPGDTLDINVYLVGVPGINAANAAADEDLKAVFEQFDEIWGAAGITIGKLRYYDITGDDEARYSVLRSDQAVTQMVQLSKRPGDSLDEVLSVNIFFTRAFAMGGAIGISMGLPGPAGLHGSHGSGVAFTSEYLGTEAQPSLGNESVDGNVFTGQILAHEIGHYVGLFHTSEDRGAGFDPLPDTPQCSRISENCPDIDNLMFPYAGASHVSITPDQQFVLQVNPLTKDATTGGAP